MSDQTNNPNQEHGPNGGQGPFGGPGFPGHHHHHGPGGFPGGGRGNRDSSDEKFARWWDERNLGEKIAAGIGLGILMVGLFALLIWVVMALWNWLMPEIFGLKTIDYWQSAGLMVLSSILFKSWGSGGGNKRQDRRRKKHLRRYLQDGQEGAPGN